MACIAAALGEAWPAMAGGTATTTATGTPEVEQCLAAAAAKYRVSLPLLRSIAERESSFNPAARGRPNKGGSTDHGLLQVNDRWLPMLARFGIGLQDLYRPCVNAEVGAWILADNIQRLGLTWNAVGAYNADSPDKRQRYANDIYRRLQRQLHQPDRLVESQRAQPAPVTGAMGAWEGEPQ